MSRITRRTHRSKGQPEVSADKHLFTSLVALIVLVPLPYGSQRNWAMAFAFLWAMAMLAVKIFQVANQDRGYSAIHHARVPLALLLAYALLLVLQLTPMGVHADLTILNGYWPYVTRDLHQTRLWLMLTLMYGAIFSLVVLLVRTRARLRLLMLAVIASGALQAMLAIALTSIKYQGNWLYFDLQHTYALGTFSGRNIFAGYLELALSVGVGLLVAGMARQRLRHGEKQGLKANTVALLAFLLSPKMILRGLLIVMVIALVMTRSRMGNAAFFASLLVAGVVVALVRKELRRIAAILVISMLVIDVLIVGQWVGLDRVVDRISDTTVLREDAQSDNQSVEFRTEASQLALSMIQARPLLGYGAGTFYTSFLPFQGDELTGYWDHPHNDFIELAVDTGLLGLALLVGLCAVVLARAGRTLLGPFRELRFAAALASVLALVCMLMHGMVDFVLQIPANAMLLCVIFATNFVIDEA